MDAFVPPDRLWMSRCFELAHIGIGYVSPNPPVGAILVYQNTILSEGYHHYFGGPHAEVMAITRVAAHQQHLIPESTLYVSLEPCCVTGKTPPCTELILHSGIKKVRISAIDPNPQVAGKGISRLLDHGVQVEIGILKEEGEHLIRSFRTNILKHRPHVVLKWAQSKYGISGVPGQQVWFSHPNTKTWSHQLRAQTDAIIVGARTVETDNPSLTTRNYPGRSPARVIYDPSGRLHQNYQVFNEDGVQIFYFSTIPNPRLQSKQISTFLFSTSGSHAEQMLSSLFSNNIGNLLVEGGSYLHHLFIGANLWDEAWVVKTQNELNSGIQAPNLKGKLIEIIDAGEDSMVGMRNEQPQ